MSSTDAKKTQRVSRTKSAKKPEKTNKERIDEYNKIVDSAELGDINLLNCALKVDPEFLLTQDDNTSPDMPRDCEIGYEKEFYDSDSGLAGAIFKWNIKVKKKRKIVFRLTCDYFCFYRGLEGVDPVVAQAFVRRVGKFATYPYLRSLTSQLAWESGAKLPRLPVLREPAAVKSGKLSSD